MLLFTLIPLFLALLIRLFYLQILGFSEFSGIAAKQHNRVFKTEPRRGAIFGRRMEPMAINLEAASVYCDPRRISDKENTAVVLSKVLKVEASLLLEKFNKDKAFAWLKRKVSDEDAKVVEQLGIRGVYLLNECKRSYPNDNLASQVIGFVGVDNDGLEGLELSFDERLKGRPGYSYMVKDAKRRTVFFDKKRSLPPQNGFNLVLTMDSVIQCIVEEELREMVRTSHASSASCVVMDPFSGAILALANYPDYNLNDFSKTPRSVMANTAISGVYEPGSVFKIVTASAALNEAKAGLDDSIYCEKGEYRIGGRVLHDFHRFGTLSFREVISKSSNIGTVKIAHKLGKEKLFEYIKKFGFGEKTGIDLPGEARGISRPPAKWSRSDITTIPIGQGIAVTPLQLVRAVSVIANGGYLVQPYIVDHITTWDGVICERSRPGPGRRVLKETTSAQMKKILRSVITEGTGRRAESKLYEMCGKTGTAQVASPRGGYYPDKYAATFLGFAPMELPAISVVVVAHDPHPVYFGGSVAGPVFKRISERVLQYLGTGGKSRLYPRNKNYREK